MTTLYITSLVFLIALCILVVVGVIIQVFYYLTYIVVIPIFHTVK